MFSDVDYRLCKFRADFVAKWLPSQESKYSGGLVVSLYHFQHSRSMFLPARRSRLGIESFSQWLFQIRFDCGHSMHSTLLPIDRPTSYIKVAASPHFSEHGYESEFTNTSKVIKTRNHLRLSRGKYYIRRLFHLWCPVYLGLCFDAPYVILFAPCMYHSDFHHSPSISITMNNLEHCPALIILAPFRQQRDNLQINSCNLHNFLQNSSDTYWVWFESKTIIMIATLCLLGRLPSDSWRTCYVTIGRQFNCDLCFGNAFDAFGCEKISPPSRLWSSYWL